MVPTIQNGCWPGYRQVPEIREPYGATATDRLSGHAGDACRWRGSVDVEDLANVFSTGAIAPREPKIPHPRSSKVFRPSYNLVPRPAAPSYANNFCDNVNNCYEACQVIQPGVNAPSAGFNDTPYPSQLSIDTAIGIPCTEAQWLACNVDDCPVFNGNCSENPQTWLNQQQQQGWNPLAGYPPQFYQEKCDFYGGNNSGFVCPLFQDESSYDEYLNSEKRKEKSRDAARSRRSRETDIFTSLAAALPMAQEQAAQLDKASVMRLAIAYLKFRHVVDGLEQQPAAKLEMPCEMDALIPKALHGFMLVLASNGDIAYLSENVSEYLGLSQMEMMGQSIYEYSHLCDHDEIREYLAMKPEEVDEKRPCNFFVRMKCTLTTKGRKVNLKSASYKVIHCVGRPAAALVPNSSQSPSRCGSGSEDNCSSDDESAAPHHQQINASLVVVGSPIPHPSNIEIPLGRHTFLSKHNLNMKFTYVDERLTEFLGWTSDDLVGHSVFEFHHALDHSILDKSFKSLFNKGQCETMAYRFLGHTGGYAWVVTQATVIHCSKQRKPVSVVCVNYILSDIEFKDEVYSVRQLGARDAVDKLKKEQTEPEILAESELQTEEPEITTVALSDVLPEKRPQTVTASLFKDRAPEPKKEWLFQNKPVVDYDTTRQRPQSVTKNIFTSTAGSETLLPPATCRISPQTATASIFAPRTEDMNKGFLTFSEDQPGLTMLKDEPEDLTHLAPTPGDVCVPLEDTPFLSDMLDEFILNNENYCSLLSPSLSSDLQASDLTDDLPKDSRNLEESLENDPFFYRDTSSSPTCSVAQSSSELMSPILERGTRSVDSLGSPGTCSPTLGSAVSEDDILMLSINDVIADEELALRAPYIPMSDQDEALQLLISDDTVMWGPTQPPDKRAKWNCEELTTQLPYEESSLAKLLRSDDDKSNNYGNLVDPVQVLGQTCRKGSVERLSKRLPGPAPLNAGGESKRMKCNDRLSPLSKTDSDETAGRGVITTGRKRIEDDALKKTRQGQTLLLKQLVAERGGLASTTIKGVVTNRSLDDTLDSGGTVDNRKNQSNSVLMNLLVSGCDTVYNELPMMIEEKLRVPLHIDVLTTTRCLMSQTMNSTSPSPKKLLMDSVPTDNGNSLDSMSEFFNAEDPLSPGSELLKVLGEM